MLLREANALLEHFCLPFESGWVRNADGTLHVAARTHMIGCSGEMVKWWFGFVHHTAEYKWWHPRDHVRSDWQGERGTGRYIGGTHIVDEYLGGELQELKANFREPAEILDVSRFAATNVSAAIHSRCGPRSEDGFTAVMLHLVHDTADGCVMRTRFWLGELEPAPPVPPSPEQLRELVPDSEGAALFAHASEEMSILAGFLPTVYRLYNPDRA